METGNDNVRFNGASKNEELRLMKSLKRFKPIRIFSTCGGFGYWWGSFGFFWHGPILPTIIPRIWFNRCGVTYGNGDLIGDRKYNSWERQEIT